MKPALRGRRLVLIDIENMVGGAVLTDAAAVAVLREVARHACLTAVDQVIIGVSHIGMLPVGLALPTARLLVRSGPNGADLELLTVLREERIAERFNELVLVSGDGIFTETVAELGAAGVSVTVVGREGCISTRLRLAASHTTIVPALAGPLGGVA